MISGFRLEVSEICALSGIAAIRRVISQNNTEPYMKIRPVEA